MQKTLAGSPCATSAKWQSVECPCIRPTTSRRLRVITGARGRDRERASQVTTTVSTRPTELLSLEQAQSQEKGSLPLTVYSVRISTGHGRGAALSDNNSHINICLIGKDGRSILRRISPVYDPERAREEVKEMCSMIDDASVGADCPTALSQPTQPAPTVTASGYTLPPKPPPGPRLRFQDGKVDEIVFLAPELGPLSGVLVGTESATWVLDELQIASSRTHHIDRFICRRLLGSQPGQGAVFLTPMPPNSTPYGTGDLQLVLTKEQAATLHSLNMDAYKELKQRLLTTTVLLTASGAGVAGLVAGIDGALPFAIGGLAGVVYQWLLQQGVDSIVATAGPSTPSQSTRGANTRGGAAALAGAAPNALVDFVEVDPDGTIVVQDRSSSRDGNGVSGNPFASTGKVLGNPAVRLAFVAAVTALGVAVLGASVPDGALGLPTFQRDQLWQLAMGILGFMTYKVALITVSLSAPVPADTVKATNKA